MDLYIRDEGEKRVKASWIPAPGPFLMSTRFYMDHLEKCEELGVGVYVCVLLFQNFLGGERDERKVWLDFQRT